MRVFELPLPGNGGGTREVYGIGIDRYAGVEAQAGLWNPPAGAPGEEDS